MSNVSSSNGLEKYPRLRFPQFKKPWHRLHLSDFVNRVTRKNSDNQTDIPLTISSKDGLINQNDFFSKQVASKDMSGYYLLHKGEFAYNKSYSVGFDFGSIKRLEKYEQGALSTLYICFTLENFHSDFIKHYFDSLKWYKEIYMISAEGARNHGLLNVPTEDFFATLHTLPTETAEQEKIAAFLDLVTARIEKQQALVDNLKKYKRGLLRRVFDQNVAMANKDWQEAKLGDICSFRRGSFPQPYGLTEWYDEIKGMPFIQVADVNDSMSINEDTNRHISEKAKKQSVFVPKGTLLVTLQGTLGKVAITSYDAYVDRTLLIINNISNNISKEFLMYAIYMKFDSEKQTADGSIIKTITKETLTNFTIHIPTLPEQVRIVRLLKTYDEQLVMNEEMLNFMIRLKKGILQNLFL